MEGRTGQETEVIGFVKHNQMERLTIKELAPYLPYGLKVIGFNNYINKDMVCDLTDRNLWTHIESQSKPLLRPLSSLTEEIEHNGERFVPMVELEKIRKGVNIYQPLNLGYPIEINIQTEDYSQEIDIYDGYLIIQKLHEWHFDTANLLGRGLALPIDGKEVKP